MQEERSWSSERVMSGPEMPGVAGSRMSEVASASWMRIMSMSEMFLYLSWRLLVEVVMVGVEVGVCLGDAKLDGSVKKN